MTLGRHLQVDLFGHSHGAGVGALVRGLPAGLGVDETAVAARMAERRPGGALASARQEPDEVTWQSGVSDGRTTGEPVVLWIANRDARPQDYDPLPRPGHADWPAWTAAGTTWTGGGRHSGRLTAPLVAAAALAAPLLEQHGVVVGAHVHQVGPHAGPVDGADVAAMRAAMTTPTRTAHAELAAPFAKAIEDARRARDSVGGVVAFRAQGLPVGLGGALEDGLEARLAAAIFTIPAVKGLSIGAGFAAAAMAGSAHNDPLEPDGRGGVRTRTNRAGGLLGGLTTGAPLWGHVAIKPTSSIGVVQDTVDLATGKAARLEGRGRHDPCIALRAAPVVRAAVELVLADALLAPGLRGDDRQAS